MSYNCFGYFKLCEKLFTGVPLTEKHMNQATEELCQYILKAGGAENMLKLGIGIRIGKPRGTQEEVRKSGINMRKRFCYTKGNRVAEELKVHEIKNLGYFLRDGKYANYYEREDMK